MNCDPQAAGMRDLGRGADLWVEEDLLSGQVVGATRRDENFQPVDALGDSLTCDLRKISNWVAIAAFRDSATEVVLGIRHAGYGHMANVPKKTRAALAEDFD